MNLRVGDHVAWTSDHQWFGKFRDYTGRVVAIVHPREDARALLPDGAGWWQFRSLRRKACVRALIEAETAASANHGIKFFAVDVARLRSTESVEARNG